ncbi:MAG: hypothetical protein DRQ78_04995 [Epsilonproteobacteria bacterium]|nr:MAG: hypothetical protein DRQ78_04995 [Campylobacterota bacterium]
MAQSLLNNVEGISADADADVMLNPSDTELNEEQQEEEIEEEQDTISELLETLREYENAPQAYDLEQWRDLYGMFFVSSVNGEDVYIWKTLKRMEYKSIAQSGALEQQELFENSVVRKCLLWPMANQEFFVSSDAGIVPSLFKQIMHKSGFVSDEVAISMIRRV